MIAAGGEKEEGEKVVLKICQAAELNPGLQRGRQEHWPLNQGGLLKTGVALILCYVMLCYFILCAYDDMN